MFRLLSSHLQALHALAHFVLDLILEGPENDSTGVETCCPKSSNIIIKFVVFD